VAQARSVIGRACASVTVNMLINYNRCRAISQFELTLVYFLFSYVQFARGSTIHNEKFAPLGCSTTLYICICIYIYIYIYIYIFLYIHLTRIKYDRNIAAHEQTITHRQENVSTFINVSTFKSLTSTRSSCMCDCNAVMRHCR